MHCFLDANVLVYALDDDERGERCRELLAASASGELDAVSSTAALEEVWHLELSGRLPSLAGQTRRAHELLSPLLSVTDAVFARALDLDAGRIGANDRIHAALCIEHALTTIVTADAAFDGVAELRRVDPGDPVGVRRLLGG